MATTRKTTGNDTERVAKVPKTSTVAERIGKTAAVHDSQGHVMKVATGIGHKKHHYTSARVRGSHGKLVRARRFLDIVSTAGGVLLREPKPAKRH